MIPDFNTEGNLPSGIHWATIDEVITRFGFNQHRLSLISGLKKLITCLRASGCTRLFIDGSFTTEKDLPNDYDACWDVTGVDPYKLDPCLLDFTSAGRFIQKAKFSGDIFPAQQNEETVGMAFLNFFQIDKATGNVKGIIAVNL